MSFFRIHGRDQSFDTFESIFMLTRSLLLIGLCLSCVQSNAATVLLTGTNFDLRYDSSTLGNYGSPSISGNVVFFTPTSFKAESLNGNGFATNSGTVNFQIIPKNNFVLADIDLQERGDYVLRGTTSFVGLTGQTRAFSLQNPLTDIRDTISSAPNLTLANGLQQNWVGSSNLDLAGLALGPNQAINYTVENLLEAYTESSASGPRRAFIEKKFTGFSVSMVSPIPEPSMMVMMFIGLGLVGFLARKSSKP